MITPRAAPIEPGPPGPALLERAWRHVVMGELDAARLAETEFLLAAATDLPLQQAARALI